MRNGAFLRMKTLEVGYTFPETLTKKAYINSARIYCSGNNLFVLSGFHMMKKQPYDCEELDVIDETARELARHTTVFYTGHCTGLPAFERMQTILGEQLRPLHSGVELDLATR